MFDIGTQFFSSYSIIKKECGTFRNDTVFQTNNEQPVDRINTVENQKLPEKINTIQKGNINLTDKIESMSKDIEKLSERIHTVEFVIQNLLKFVIN